MFELILVVCLQIGEGLECQTMHSDRAFSKDECKVEGERLAQQIGEKAAMLGPAVSAWACKAQDIDA